MPTPDVEERFRRWIKLTSEMHDNAHFTPNPEIAWTPMRKPLAACRIALVSTAGVHLKSQPAHDLTDPYGDSSFREIPGSMLASEIAVDHTHYDTTDANLDPNCVFPIDRLRELAEEHVIGSSAPVHFGFMGFIPDGRRLRDSTAPLVAEKLLNEDVDAVVLIPG
jgi:D-proline reductase (dithiol) PrdB